MVVSIILFIFATINNKVIIMGITIGLLIPLLGTMLGAAFVFFMKKDMSPRLQKSLLGIAIQNIPEGAIISMPMCAEGNSKRRSFLLGSLRGIVRRTLQPLNNRLRNRFCINDDFRCCDGIIFIIFAAVFKP